MLWIPDSHSECTLVNFNWKGLQALRPEIDAFVVEKRKKGLILIGAPGVGKTHVMVGVFKAMQERGLLLGSELLFNEWADFIGVVRGLLFESKVLIDDAVRKLAPRVCIFDDIKYAREYQGEVERGVLRAMIEAVYDDGKICMLSTNADDVQGLIERWGLEDYWVSRLHSCFDVVKMTGKDWRMKE